MMPTAARASTHPAGSDSDSDSICAAAAAPGTTGCERQATGHRAPGTPIPGHSDSEGARLVPRAHPHTRGVPPTLSYSDSASMQSGARFLLEKASLEPANQPAGNASIWHQNGPQVAFDALALPVYPGHHWRAVGHPWGTA